MNDNLIEQYKNEIMVDELLINIYIKELKRKNEILEKVKRSLFDWYHNNETIEDILNKIDQLEKGSEE